MVYDNLKTLPDTSLIEKFKATGDNEYFSEIFRRHKKKLFEVCFRFSGHVAIAEELTQETFTKAFTNIDQFSGGNFYSWLFAIAKSVCINDLNKRIRENRKIQEGAVEEQNDLERSIVLASHVKTILNGLDPNQRICLKLFYIEGYSYKEVAQITGLSEEMVKSYMQNGKRNFEIQWENLSKNKKVKEIHGR